MRARHLMVAAFMSLAAATGTIAAEPNAAGLWQAIDEDTGQPSGWFLIRDQGGELRRHHRAHVSEAGTRTPRSFATNAQTTAATSPGSASTSSAA